MEPWLDSLSEDWKSEHRSSSPAPSLSSSRQNHSSILSRSQSRIPHLAKNMRKDSSSGSFLRHRSTRGQARQNSESILRERSASSLNMPPQSGSQKQASLPRRPSSAFSESQNSVQHHPIHEKPAADQTPEWKRRLIHGEDLGSDGFDLFSPSKLEGIFKNPAPSGGQQRDHNSEQTESGSVRRKPFTLPTTNPLSDQYSSVRQTRSLPNLEVLEEVNEEDELSGHDLSALPSSPARADSAGSIRGLVKHRVQSLERASANVSGASSPTSSQRDGYDVSDPRWRTVSGQEELKNELISPVTMSKQNSIRATALRNSLEANVQALDSRLKKILPVDMERPSSSASDRDISYGNKSDLLTTNNNEPLPDLTSQSLPDDLSMGTQDFISHGGFINSRRGGRSNEASFLHKSLSLSQEQSQEHSQFESNWRPTMQFHSSPPQNSRFYDESIEQSKFSASAPGSPHDTSVVHHTESHSKPVSSGSPLKLFGNRDTYTNNKLMRILSHFEEPGDQSENQEESPQEQPEQQDNALRMSQFGKGELDGFGFVQDVPKPAPIESALVSSNDRIFRSVLDDNGETHDMTSKTRPEYPQGDQRQGKPTEASDVSEKDRMTKRRKTLVKDMVSIEGHELEFKVSQLDEVATLAGKKRKDARPGDDGMPADPEVLASRSLLKPKLSRRTSVNRVPSDTQREPIQEESGAESPAEGLTEALAAELASFAQDAAQLNNDSRKPSLATKDYMEEANKVMQFIRSRGKPKPALPEISEPENVSELNPDAILDLDIDAESTKDDFSRPPSRDRTAKPLPDRRHVRHDSLTADYLKKYQDQDDMDMLTSTSVFGTGNLAPIDKRQIQVEGSDRNALDDSQNSQESSPPNIRILNHSETVRKRKYSTSTVDAPADSTLPLPISSQHSDPSSTQRTFPTSSSTSGHKGVIACGTVSIPDQVGLMTFDHEKKMWVKKMASKDDSRPFSRLERTEDDPFGDIPDLSIDEQQELERARREREERQQLEQQSEGKVADSKAGMDSKVQQQPYRQPLAELDPEMVTKGDQRDQQLSESEDEDEDEHINQSSLRSKASEHEANLHNGVASEPPVQLKEGRRQARVVTIAFSSPVVSGVNYANMSDQDFDDLPREDDLPIDDSQIDLEDEHLEDRIPEQFATQKVAHSQQKQSQTGTKEPKNAVNFQPRTISPIAEDDEDQFEGQMSMIRVRQSSEMTPAGPGTISKRNKATNKASSILCLTPLSEFSVHQIDSAKHLDQSYVEERKHPNALRQAHGSLALAVDELVKAITDAVPDELYWEQLHRLALKKNSVSSVHGLQEYCPVLEELSVHDNQLTQVNGLPQSLRVLDIHNNMLNDLTSWGHLHNLQYLDVSGNQLESLEGFSSLVHLRSLKVNNNRVTNIDGILDLNGLLELELSGNDLVTVDFEGSELSRLKSLDLSHNQLIAARNLDCLPALQELDLSHNMLEEFAVPSGGGKVLDVTDLRLAGNQLSTIDLRQLPSLTRLDLDSNSIKDIHGLSLAYNLEVLSLREQRDSPDILSLVLSTPNECRQIRLSSNHVQNGTFALPSTPQNNLRELEIAACGISEFPMSFGACFPNCRSLNANFNAIGDIAPLRKMLKLKSLFLAGNRIRKLRRTCVVLSRLGLLESLELRDNPLTVGFYSPLSMSTDRGAETDLEGGMESKYLLPQASAVDDLHWIKMLDEITGLKRRTIELLLVDHCRKLVKLDGLALSRERVLGQDAVWGTLTARGVLKKPDPSPGENSVVGSIVEEQDGGHDYGQGEQGQNETEGREQEEQDVPDHVTSS
ncbi:Septation initiation network scaffold protein cdc11 [Exophiala dermatitidis]